MSSFMVSNRHLNALVNYASHNDVSVIYNGVRTSVREEPNAVFKILLAANRASMQTRYPRDTDDHGAGYALRLSLPTDLGPLLIIKQAQCFDYQACEVDHYELGFAAAITRAIINTAISKLPGYDALPWGLDNDEEELPAVPKIRNASTTRASLKAVDGQEDGPF